MLLRDILTLQADRPARQVYKFQGLRIGIENPRGSVRKGKDPVTKKSWRTVFRYPYGYIYKTEGVDGDRVDVYIGPDPKTKEAYVIHQRVPATGKYDEDKVMLGFKSPGVAKRAYLGHYNDPRFFGSMTVMTMEHFKKQVSRTVGKPQAIT